MNQEFDEEVIDRMNFFRVMCSCGGKANELYQKFGLIYGQTRQFGSTGENKIKVKIKDKNKWLWAKIEYGF